MIEAMFWATSDPKRACLTNEHSAAREDGLQHRHPSRRRLPLPDAGRALQGLQGGRREGAARLQALPQRLAHRHRLEQVGKLNIKCV